MKPCPVCQGTMHDIGGRMRCDFCKHEEPVKVVTPVKTSFYETVANELF